MMKRFFPAISLCILVALSGQALAQVADLGQIAFENSGSEAAQASFIEGVLLLHSFEYDDAAEAFREAQEIDSSFAMAYWGEAMTYNHPIWFASDPEKGRAALNRMAATPEARQARAPTDREKAYLAAVERLFGEGDHLARNRAYAAAMADLAAQYPEDLDAQAFHALAVLGTSGRSRDVSTYMRAAAIAEEIYEQNPNHPGALHYLIHSYDDPVHAPLGLRAARLYGDVAPAASHALHMPSHIFVALGMWEEVVSANVASAAAADARRERKNLGLNDRGYHALWWLTYGYLQQGRYDEARALLAELEDDYANRPDDATRIPFHLTVMRAAYLIDSEQWDDDVRVEVETGDMALGMASVYYFTSGLKAYHQGDQDGLQAALEALRTQLEAEMPAETASAETAHAHGTAPAVDDPTLQAALIMEQELEALTLYAAGKVDEALVLLNEAAAAEEGMSFMFGPPKIVKPSHELLGELLLEQERFDEARAAFEGALERAPRRTRSLLGLARAAAGGGDEAAAQATYATLADILKKADVSLPEQDEVRRGTTSDD